MNNNLFLGSWSLKKFVVTDNDGVSREWQNGAGQGLLIYSPDGYMSVSINADPEILRDLVDSEKTLQRCLFYAGTYEINEFVVTHKVMFATNGPRIGEEMKRTFDLSQDRLTLKAVGDYGSSELLWERAISRRLFTNSIINLLNDNITVE